MSVEDWIQRDEPQLRRRAYWALGFALVSAGVLVLDHANLGPYEWAFYGGTFVLYLLVAILLLLFSAAWGRRAFSKVMLPLVRLWVQRRRT